MIAKEVMMSRTIAVGIISFCWMSSNGAFAAIPEPDAVLYGPALVNGVAAQQRSSVVLVTRLPGGQEIGRFDFGDCNADGHVDQRDVARFLNCFTGSGGGPVGPECRCADLDNDGDVDLDDWKILRGLMTGP